MKSINWYTHPYLSRTFNGKIWSSNNRFCCDLLGLLISSYQNGSCMPLSATSCISLLLIFFEWAKRKKILFGINLSGNNHCLYQISRLIVNKISVSHTTDDLVFVWLPEDKTPLAVDSGIELPQLELVSNFTGDCTSNYSTGLLDTGYSIFENHNMSNRQNFHTQVTTQPTELIKMNNITSS